MTISLPSRFNKAHALLILLCIGSLFIKNPKVYGIAISDIALLLGLVTLTGFKYRFIRLTNAALLALALAFILLVAISVIRVPDKALFAVYYIRLLKSFLICFLGYVFIKRLDIEDQLRIISFFFYAGIVTILLDTIYSLGYYNSQRNEISNMWLLYAALKVSYIYADKNMVAFTIALLMLLSSRFFKGKYMFVLWFLTIISLSRSGILINTLLLLYFEGKKFLKLKLLVIIIVTVLFAIALIYLMGLQSLFLDRLTISNDLSLQGRLNLQLIGINMWLDSPLIGKGLSGYEQYFYSYYTEGERTYYPHNLYIYLLAEFGLIGIIILFCIAALVSLLLYRKKLSLMVMIYAMFGMFLFNLTEYHFFFLLGVLLAINLKEADENSIFPSVSS